VNFMVIPLSWPRCRSRSSRSSSWWGSGNNRSGSIQGTRPPCFIYYGRFSIC
jgi:hypothetical protein